MYKDQSSPVYQIGTKGVLRMEVRNIFTATLVVKVS